MDNDIKNPNQNQKKTVADSVGGFVEKVGHKVSDAGASKLGQKIHDLGDSLEKHHSDPNHPHKA
jgi:hypothetical protein